MAVLLSLLAIFATYIQAKTFSHSDTLSGGDISYEIDIGDSSTTVTITTATSNALALGFGGTTMSGTYSLIKTTSGGSAVVAEGTLRSPQRGINTISGANNWNIIVSGNTMTLTRDNTVTCSGCYNFDPSATSLSIVYAIGSGTTSFSGHGRTDRNGLTLTANPDPTTASPTTAIPTLAEGQTARPTTAAPTTSDPTTARPTTSSPTTADPTTAMPTTSAPTTARPTLAEGQTAPPTPSPTTAQPSTAEPTMEEYVVCVAATEVQQGLSISIERRASDEMMRIVLAGPNTHYFAYGFGGNVMDGTYAISVEGDTVNVVERTLGNQAPGDVITDGSVIEVVGEDNGDLRSVLITRPYAFDGTFDFTDLLRCNVDEIDVIAAEGSGDTAFGYHLGGRSIGTLTRFCDCDDGINTGMTTGSPGNDTANTMEPSLSPTPQDENQGDDGNKIFNSLYIGFVVMLSMYFMVR